MRGGEPGEAMAMADMAVAWDKLVVVHGGEPGAAGRSWPELVAPGRGRERRCGQRCRSRADGVGTEPRRPEPALADLVWPEASGARAVHRSWLRRGARPATVGTRGEADHWWFGEEEKKRRNGREEKMEKLERTGMFV